MSGKLHEMPFGPEIRDDGTVRFRLWAPNAEGVALCVRPGRQEKTHHMGREEGGWFVSEPLPVGWDTPYLFVVDDDLRVPDPVSRCQVDSVHGPTLLIDPRGYEWEVDDWEGRQWDGCVVYELHVGAFTPEGTFSGVESKLDHLVDLGVDAIELLPVSSFPGDRNWGYDGVLPFAPDRSYGHPNDLKRLVDGAHRRGLMVFMDVVYNHFGPEGNYLYVYANDFFTKRHETPWGEAINFDGHNRHWVREYFIHNALFWLEEYRMDGLRFDAVHAIVDDSEPDILEEIAHRVRKGPGAGRRVHLVLENDDNEAHYLARDDGGNPTKYVAQWNDDFHHVMHVLTTGETDGYYADYAEETIAAFGRCLTEGFVYQGEPSPYRGGRERGEPSSGLPPDAFVSLLQNHDQVGNRPMGDRLGALASDSALEAATGVLLLMPTPVLLFMGQEWNTKSPFPFFCDFGPDLAESVTNGRREEFAKFEGFSDPEARKRIPDPNDRATFEQAILDWESLDGGNGRRWLLLYRELLDIRKRDILPATRGRVTGATWRKLSDRAAEVFWQLDGGGRLTLLANLGPSRVKLDPPVLPGRRVWPADPAGPARGAGAALEGWEVAWFLKHPSG
jgi:malto-oligosyltrehalose trehalohydrolase